jgi:hypothetical protein
LLELNGADLRQLPLSKRKAKLAQLLAHTHGAIALNEHSEADGGTMFTEACRVGLEGIVSKRFDAPYRSGRSADWIKTRTRTVRPPCARGRAGFEKVLSAALAGVHGLVVYLEIQARRSDGGATETVDSDGTLMVDLILRRMRSHEAAEGHPPLIAWQDTDYAIVDRNRPAARQMVGRMRLEQRPAGALWCWYMQSGGRGPGRCQGIRRRRHA